MDSLPQDSPAGKVCTDCGQWKPLPEYYRKRATGYGCYCKSCHKARSKRDSKARYEANPEAMREAARQAYWADPEKVRAAHREARLANPEKARQYDKEWWARNRDKGIERKKRYREENLEKIRDYRERTKAGRAAYNARYYQENKERIAEYHRRYREADPEKYTAIHRSWKQRNKDAVNSYGHRRRVQQRANGGDYTAAEWRALKEQFDYLCLRCGRREPEITLTVDHIVPVIEGGPNSIDNIQPLCRGCNSFKHRRPLDYRESPAEPTLAGSVEPDTTQWIEETRDPGFIDRLRAGLKEHRMTGRQFAAECGCSPSNISMILCGRTSGSVPKYIWRRARDLGLLEVS